MFFVYNRLGDLLIDEGMSKEDGEEYIRHINKNSHNKISDLEVKELRPDEKNLLKLLFDNFKR